MKKTQVMLLTLIVAMMFSGQALAAAGGKFAETLRVTTMYAENGNVYSVPLGSLYVDASGPISASSSPKIVTLDNVPKVVWTSSSETTGILFSHTPTASFAGLQIDVFATSSDADGTAHALDWTCYYQNDGAAIGTAIAQTGVSFTEASMDTVTDKITLTLDATGIAAVTAGSGSLNIEIGNNGSSSGTLEVVDIKVTEL